MRGHALERMIVEALGAHLVVDDDTLAVACFDGGRVVLRGSAGARPRPRMRCRRPTRSPVSAPWTSSCACADRGVGHRAAARTEAAVLDAFIADVLSAETMHVSASGGTVTLSGRVDFPFQRDEAEGSPRAFGASLSFAIT